MVRTTAPPAQTISDEIERMRDAMTVFDVLQSAEITLRDALATLGVSDTGAATMIRTCAEAYPAEACGFILSDGTVVALPNDAPEPRRDYSIAPGHLARFSERVVGVFHSHPDGEAILSARDRALMQAGWRYVVIATRGPVVSDVAIM